ncbi:MAG: helix-turn-helix transcriptional regulator [Proteobacteria bacterium]|nr:helix-turn-helix transcriptional regulator [Pseudomonadota bacterium]
MSTQSYNQFCPIAKACEIIEPRWTLLILCEMWSGSSRFNEIKKGVPGMSPTLFSKRLKEMILKGIISRERIPHSKQFNYKITPTGQELAPIVYALGQWAHKHVNAEISLQTLDAGLLMWNMRRNIDCSAIKSGKTVIEFILTEGKSEPDCYWLIIKPGYDVDLCMKDPGFDVDLYVKADLKALTSVWMGLSSMLHEVAQDKIILLGDQELAKSIDQWMIKSKFAS